MSSKAERSEREQLLRALRPFAKVGQLLDKSDPSTDNVFGISCEKGSASVRNGHFKNAAKLYERMTR